MAHNEPSHLDLVFAFQSLNFQHNIVLIKRFFFKFADIISLSNTFFILLHQALILLLDCVFGDTTFHIQIWDCGRGQNEPLCNKSNEYGFPSSKVV